METVLRDQAFYRESGGGVTVSGGEPMMQFEFTRALLQAAKDAHLHTCLETCGVAAGDRYCQVLPLVDLFLWDLKDTDAERLRRTAQAPLETIVENLRRVDAAGAKTLLRCLMIPGYNFEESHLAQIAELVRSLGNCLGAELLAYHRLGTSKRELLGLDDSTLRFEPPSEEQMAWARGFLRDRGVGVGRSSQVVE